jgi:Cytochrome c biogenesis protein
MIGYRTLCVVLAFSLSTVLKAEEAPSLEIRPSEWKYGMIEQGERIATKIDVLNSGSTSLLVTFVPTCTCLSVEPSSSSIAAGASKSFELRYDSKDDQGKVSRAFILKTDRARSKPQYFILSGVVRVDKPVEEKAAAGPAAGSATGNGELELRYYYTPGCRSCEEFLAKTLPELESRYGVLVRLERRDLLDSAVYEELSAFASTIGATIRAVPALRIGNTLLQGEDEITERLPGLLYTKGGSSIADSSGGAGGKQASSGAAFDLAILPVVAAGLIDGINPCAFTTLIFLLASLALAGRGRREVLVIGLLFTVGVFATYLGAGFGLFAALRAASGVALVSTILRWVLVVILVVLAALSLVDYGKVKAGKASEMILQLPNSLKLRIHASIRTRAKTAALAGSSLVLGFLVSLFEFACTGQVYLPTLAYLARSQGNSEAAWLLVLYNLCFIAPLLVVFAASYMGVSSKRITELFQRRMAATKLALALVFLGLAALTLLT